MISWNVKVFGQIRLFATFERILSQVSSPAFSFFLRLWPHPWNFVQTEVVSFFFFSASSHKAFLLLRRKNISNDFVLQLTSARCFINMDSCPHKPQSIRLAKERRHTLDLKLLAYVHLENVLVPFVPNSPEYFSKLSNLSCNPFVLTTSPNGISRGNISVLVRALIASRKRGSVFLFSEMVMDAKIDCQWRIGNSYLHIYHACGLPMVQSERDIKAASWIILFLAPTSF